MPHPRREFRACLVSPFFHRDSLFNVWERHILSAIASKRTYLSFVITTWYNSTTDIVSGSTMWAPWRGTRSKPSFLKREKKETLWQKAGIYIEEKYFDRRIFIFTIIFIIIVYNYNALIYGRVKIKLQQRDIFISTLR